MQGITDLVRRVVPRFVRRSYATKFAIALFVLGLLVGGLGTYATDRVTAAVEQNVREQHSAAAAQAARNFQTWDDRNRMLTGVLTEATAIRNRDVQGAEQYLRQQRLSFPDETHRIDYVDTRNGTVLASTGTVETLAGSDFPDPARIDTGLDPVEPLVTEPYLIDNETLAISYVRPVTGDAERAVVLTMDLGAYGKQFRTHGRPELTLIVDEENRIVMSDATSTRYGVNYSNIFERLPDEHGVLATARAIEPGESPSGAMEVTERPSRVIADAYGFKPDSYVVGYYYFEETDRVLLFYQSAGDAYGFVAAVRRYGTLVTVASVLLIAIIGAVLGRNTAVSIDRLTTKTERIETGDFDVSFESDRIDNIGQLYDAFEEMQATIQAQLRESALIDNASDLIMQVDRDGEITFQSPSARTILGYEPDGMVGSSLLSYIHPEDEETVASMLADPDTSDRAEFRVRDADGEWRVLAGACEQLPENPFVTGLVMTGRDVTERKEHERELETLATRLTLALEGTETGVLEWDLEANEISWDEQLERLFEFQPGEFTGAYEQLLDRIDPEDRSEVEAARERGLVEGDFEAEFRVSIDGETRRWVHARAEVFYENGEPDLMVGIITDVTQRKRREQRLEDQNQKLELLNRIVRHDIRNDMEVILGYAPHVRDAIEDEVSRDRFDTMVSQGEHVVELTEIVRDLMSAMLGDSRAVEPMGLAPVLERELEAVRSMDGVTITGPSQLPGVTVRADEMLGTVFRNILKNAVRHNDGEEPEISVTVAEHDTDVVVRIADNGPGVPDDQKDEIFGRGEKGLESPGSGVGLYLVETIVDSYGGEVWVEDNEPHGAVFAVQLSKADPSEIHTRAATD